MKKALVIVLTFGLIAASLSGPALAGKKKKKKKPKRVERVQEARYELGSSVGTSGAGACSGCPTFPNAPGENWIKVEVTDDNAPLTAISLSWDTNADGIADTGVSVCGTTDGFIEIPSGVSPTAFPDTVGGPGCPGSAATAGTIKVTFSNKP